MIFQHSLDAVLDGTKTQTRRRVRPAWAHNGRVWVETIAESPHTQNIHRVILRPKSAPYTGWRVKWEVGRTYAVQPARGRKSVARIMLTDIDCQDVRDIDRHDVRAEGYTSKIGFLLTWISMHDNALWKRIMSGQYTMHEKVAAHRPENLYSAWVLTFRLVDTP